MQTLDFLTTSLTVVLFVVFWLTMCLAAVLFICNDCSHKDFCDKHYKDKEFTPPCRQNQNNSTFNFI